MRAALLLALALLVAGPASAEEQPERMVCVGDDSRLRLCGSLAPEMCWDTDHRVLADCVTVYNHGNRRLRRAIYIAIGVAEDPLSTGIAIGLGRGAIRELNPLAVGDPGNPSTGVEIRTWSAALAGLAIFGLSEAYDWLERRHLRARYGTAAGHKRRWAKWMSKGYLVFKSLVAGRNVWLGIQSYRRRREAAQP